MGRGRPWAGPSQMGRDRPRPVPGRLWPGRRLGQSLPGPGPALARWARASVLLRTARRSPTSQFFRQGYGVSRFPRLACLCTKNAFPKKVTEANKLWDPAQPRQMGRGRPRTNPSQVCQDRLRTASSQSQPGRRPGQSRAGPVPVLARWAGLATCSERCGWRPVLHFFSPRLRNLGSDDPVPNVVF